MEIWRWWDLGAEDGNFPRPVRAFHMQPLVDDLDTYQVEHLDHSWAAITMTFPFSALVHLAGFMTSQINTNISKVTTASTPI